MARSTRASTAGSAPTARRGLPATLIRRGADGQKRMYTVPVATIIETGDLARDPVVMPGDIIFVPEGFF